jgi:hypothetical protein
MRIDVPRHIYWPMAMAPDLPGIAPYAQLRSWHARGKLPSTYKDEATGRMIVDVAEIQRHMLRKRKGKNV